MDSKNAQEPSNIDIIENGIDQDLAKYAVKLDEKIKRKLRDQIYAADPKTNAVHRKKEEKRLAKIKKYQLGKYRNRLEKNAYKIYGGKENARYELDGVKPAKPNEKQHKSSKPTPVKTAQASELKKQLIKAKKGYAKAQLNTNAPVKSKPADSKRKNTTSKSSQKSGSNTPQPKNAADSSVKTSEVSTLKTQLSSAKKSLAKAKGSSKSQGKSKGGKTK
jgi:hypothetical protein